MKQKQTLIIVLIVVGFAIAVLVLFFVFLRNNNQNKSSDFSNNSRPSPLASPSPTTTTQGQADINFSKQINNVYTKYPWYEKLPITTENYFLYFDPDTKRFVAKVYDSSNQLDSSQLAEVESAIKNTISGFGNNASSFPVDFKTGY